MLQGTLPRRVAAPRVSAADQDRFLATTRVGGPADPKTCTRDIVVEKSIVLPVASAVLPVTLTSEMLAAWLPVVAGLTFRLQKISIYGHDGAGEGERLEVTDLASDLAGFIDFGTFGQQRPQIHLAPALELRQRWLVKGTSVDLYSITGSGGVGTFWIVGATLQVRLPVGA